MLFGQISLAVITCTWPIYLLLYRPVKRHHFVVDFAGSSTVGENIHQQLMLALRWWNHIVFSLNHTEQKWHRWKKKNQKLLVTINLSWAVREFKSTRLDEWPRFRATHSYWLAARCAAWEEAIGVESKLEGRPINSFYQPQPQSDLEWRSCKQTILCGLIRSYCIN